MAELLLFEMSFVNEETLNEIVIVLQQISKVFEECIEQK
jgi:hypothetical protein